MSDALWGVVLGGGIGSIIPIFTIIFDLKKWKKERKIQILKDRRDKLELLFSDILKKMQEGISKNSFDVGMISAVLTMCPQEVVGSFDRVMLHGSKSDVGEQKMALLDMSVAMNQHLAKLDSEISKVVS